MDSHRKGYDTLRQVGLRKKNRFSGVTNPLVGAIDHEGPAPARKRGIGQVSDAMSTAMKTDEQHQVCETPHAELVL